MNIKEFLYNRRAEIAIFATAIIIRMIYLGQMARWVRSEAFFMMMADSQTYFAIARYLAGKTVAGEAALILGGPGYGAFVAIFFGIFGQNAWPIVFAQIVLSSAASVLIYLIAKELLDKTIIALCAGMITAVSITSISLATAILSDSLFFFLMVLAFYLFIKGLRKSAWGWFIGAGIVLGIASLVRPVGQFLPIVFLVSFFILTKDAVKRKRLQKMVAAAVIIPILITGSWAVRNYIKHDIFTVSDSGTLAFKHYLSARIMFEADDSETLLKYREDMAEPLDVDGHPATLKETHDDAVATATEVILEHPVLFLKVYLIDMYENITMQNTLFEIQLKEYESAYKEYTRKFTWEGKQPLIFLLTLFGFFLMYKARFRREMLFLILIWCYFAVLSGVTFWQGSRIFHPAILAWSIAVGMIIQYALERIGARRRIEP